MTNPTEFVKSGGTAPAGQELDAEFGSAVFLLDESGRKIPVREPSCLLGRSAACDIVLPGSQVSGRHALIHHQAAKEYVLVDLGSSNGTFIEGRQVAAPVRLRDQQRFQIAQHSFTFCQPEVDPSGMTWGRTARTVPKVSTSVCWLLLLDIINSTELGRSLPAKELPLVFGKWFSECRQLVHQHNGTVDKFLGDALFAFWPDQPGTPPPLHHMLDALLEKQKKSHPPFRWILHWGNVTVGGTPAASGERVMGEEVHFVFRLEKLAGGLQLPHLFSEAAAQHLLPLRSSREIGRYPLKGFDGKFRVFALESKT